MSRHARGKFHRGNAQPIAWRAAHPEFFRRRDPQFHKPEFRILSVKTEFWSDSARWIKTAGAWSCYSAGPHLLWMVGKTQAESHLELLRLEADYSWEKTNNPKHMHTGTSTVIESSRPPQSKAPTVRISSPELRQADCIANGIAGQSNAVSLRQGDCHV